MMQRNHTLKALALLSLASLPACSLFLDLDGDICEEDEPQCNSIGAGGDDSSSGGQALGGQGAGDGGSSLGGASGLGGDASGTGGQSGGACQSSDCELVLTYFNDEAVPSSERVRPHFQIKNNGLTDVDLSELTIRYYFTPESGTDIFYQCTYALGEAAEQCVNLVFGAFEPLAVAAPGATHYLEISFSADAGKISAFGGSSGNIQGFFKNSASDGVFDQSNDYSFGPDFTEDYGIWSHVTLYRQGELVFGSEP